MGTSYATAELSASFVSWINDELRGRIEHQAELEREAKLSNRMKAVWLVSFSNLSLLAMNLFHW